MIEPSTHVRQELHDLPEVPLPDALWQRVEAGRRLKIRRRKLFTGIASLALVAVMATPLLAPLFTNTYVLRSEPQAARSEQDVHAELHAIDRALQAAYDRGASDAEIAPMWVVRNTLLADSQLRLTKPRINRS